MKEETKFTIVIVIITALAYGLSLVIRNKLGFDIQPMMNPLLF